MSQGEWREQRRIAAAEHAAALDRRRIAEAERAGRLIAQFVVDARARNLRTQKLKVSAHNGRWRYRTGIEGWYLRRNRSLGVGTDGGFYILSTPGSVAALLRGASVQPEDAPLEVGRGGRDGESMPLEELLALRLAAGDDWS